MWKRQLVITLTLGLPVGHKEDSPRPRRWVADSAQQHGRFLDGQSLTYFWVAEKDLPS